MATSLAKRVERKQQADDHDEPDEVPEEPLQPAGRRDDDCLPKLLAIWVGVARFRHGISSLVTFGLRKQTLLKLATVPAGLSLPRLPGRNHAAESFTEIDPATPLSRVRAHFAYARVGA
jgi:hypothetical protein